MTVIDDAGAEARVLDRGKKDGFSLVLLVRDNRAQQRDPVLITIASFSRNSGLLPGKKNLAMATRSEETLTECSESCEISDKI